MWLYSQVLKDINITATIFYILISRLRGYGLQLVEVCLVVQYAFNFYG